MVKGDEGPPRLDGSDKYFGFENVVKNGLTDDEFGNTCYCNSILQCLYFSKPFRENIVNFPHRSTYPGQNNTPGHIVENVGENGLSKIQTDLVNSANAPSQNGGGVTQKPKTPISPVAPKKNSTTVPPTPGKPEDPNTPEAKKKAALATGPMLVLDSGNQEAYGMEESLFTAMKDIFETIMAQTSRTGVISPQRLVEVVKRENEMFRSNMHQDAHEFLNYVLNEVIENVESHQKKLHLMGLTKPDGINGRANGVALPQGDATITLERTDSAATQPTVLNTGWIHSLFEGLLTSETKCLTCEKVSRRDEPFLDLSIDLEKHTSVTSCLRAFSASEMLCERNKFHCDGCGGLQEAEKRMKIKRLPRILALHLKRFKYMEELGRHQKLFHRVVYPYYLRLFNTTDDSQDPDRLYELYAVVVHIGGGPYHGHYVSIIKTEDRGWLLFDDELVEPVDKSYVKNFFGDKPGLACAYVLFYQETTFEKMQRDLNEENAAPEATTAQMGNLASSVLQSLAVNDAHNASSPSVAPTTASSSSAAPSIPHSVDLPIPRKGSVPHISRSVTTPITASISSVPSSQNTTSTDITSFNATPTLSSPLTHANTTTSSSPIHISKRKDKHKTFTPDTDTLSSSASPNKDKSDRGLSTRLRTSSRALRPGWLSKSSDKDHHKDPHNNNEDTPSSLPNHYRHERTTSTNGHSFTPSSVPEGNILPPSTPIAYGVTPQIGKELKEKKSKRGGMGGMFGLKKKPSILGGGS
ncbi:cysteine proteinase [Ascobolus immersus RN42]|uniref:ubiquitinyl hydrolase 1 n=1 Tax=Ascobolus immersus RN42 TaxID=1160509 RepID=A0A3N4IRN5_ASCIM|nr:cysteine proteinase [Ascobolus immersus RN42]